MNTIDVHRPIDARRRPVLTSRSKSAWLALAWSIACAATVSLAQAQTDQCASATNSARCLCVPHALGSVVRNEPPFWIGDPAPYSTRIDDPRWRGCAAISLNDSTQALDSLRVVTDDQHVYMSARIKVNDFLGAPGNNRMLLAFLATNPAGVVKPALLEVSLNSTATVSASTAVRNVSFYWLGNESGSASPAPGDRLKKIPGTFTAVGTWQNDIAGWITSSGTDRDFAFNLRIPRAQLATTDASPNHRSLWMQLIATNPGLPLTTVLWPAGARATTSLGVETYPPMATWGTAGLTPASGNPPEACNGGGVDMTYADIFRAVGGTSTYDHQIDFRTPGPGVTQPPNALRARTWNRTGADLVIPLPSPPAASAPLQPKITARFRVANWGSQPMFSQWEDGVMPESLWKPVACEPAIPAKDTPGNSSTPIDASNNPSIPVDGSAQVECIWRLTDTEAGEFASGTRAAHQCIMAELRDNLGLKYLRSSASSNFEFVRSSTFTREAEISIAGLASRSGDGRDVYLRIVRQGMPDKLTGDELASRAQWAERAKNLPKDDRLPWRGDQFTAKDRAPLLGGFITAGIYDADSISALAAQGLIAKSLLDEVVPNYTVEVYHDTGDALVIDGQRRPLIEQQSSFSYRPVHAGLLTGWQTAEVFLAQDRAPLGSRVEQIAPDFYRIRQVPDGGSIRLGSTVQARESRATAAAGYLGATRPSGNLALTNQTGLAALLALEQELDDSWSAELTVGRQHLAGRGTGTSLDVTSLGAGVKWYVMQGQTRPFISLSLERQSVDHGPSGWARVAGCGLQHRINNRFDAELRAMHTVGTPFAPDLRTTRLLAGLRHAF